MLTMTIIMIHFYQIATRRLYVAAKIKRSNRIFMTDATTVYIDLTHQYKILHLLLKLKILKLKAIPKILQRNK